MPAEEVFTFRCSKEALDKLEEAAEKEMRSRASLITYLIDNIDIALAAIHKEKSKDAR